MISDNDINDRNNIHWKRIDNLVKQQKDIMHRMTKVNNIGM